MNRRQFLASTVALATIAGCTSQPASQADTTPTETTAPSTSTATTEDITAMEPNDDGEGQLGEMRYFLNDSGLDVQTFQFDGTDIILKYLHESEQRSEYVDRVSIVTFEYAAHVNYDGVGEQVTARTVDEFGDTETTYYIQRDWVETYNQDEDVTEEDLLKKVADENNISLLA